MDADSEGSSDPPSGSSDDVVMVPNLRRDRDGTLRLMSWWRQDRVRSARVMVVGAGAIGNEVIKNLALLGIGHIVLVDRDSVEMANLSRSVLFRESDEGRSKVMVAAERAKELNPGVQITAMHSDVALDVGLGVYRRMDVVIGCLDSRWARLVVNNACWLTDVPWVDGAIQEMFGEVRVFVPGQGACYACTLTAADWTILRETRPCSGLAIGNVLEGKVPTTPTIASIIGAIESQEALKLIHGMATPAGKVFVFRGLTMEGDLLTLRERADCQSHYTFADVVELPEAKASTTTFRDLLTAAAERLGGQPYLDLRGREVVSELECPSCGSRERIGLVEARLTPAHAFCPVCDHDMRDPDTTHVVTGDEWFVDNTLQSAGIPPLDIIAARSAGSAVAFELTGDAPDVLGEMLDDD
jgi:molybdopterin/thiamine biosynthesis adenylyltransferase